MSETSRGPVRTTLTDAQLKRQRSRSIAIALGLAFMFVLFYVITIIKMTPVIAPKL
jgi:type IV secretory pathway component VirB8